MFGRNVFRKRDTSAAGSRPVVAQFMMETLEERRLLSAAALHHAATHAVHHAIAKHAALKHASKAGAIAASSVASTAASTTSTSTTTTSDTGDDRGKIENKITFNEAPSAIRAGLTTLASADSLAAPTSTQTVYLGNRDGVETYTLDYSATGTITHITVDQNGNAVTAPTLSTETWADLSGTGTGSDAAAAAEISAIVTALGLTAPTHTTTVNISTPTSGTAVYTLHLSSASSTTSTSTTAASGYDDEGHGPGGGTIAVDANGLPVGNQTLPFSVIPTAIQNGINNNLPTGATALDITSTQNVNVRTIDGVTLFSTTFTSSGTSSVVTVNSLGVLTSLPTDTTSSFSDLPAAVQAELQTLATADGATGTISSSQNVQVYTEANGTVIYSISVSATESDSNTATVTISVDQNGNPTVSPQGTGGRGCGGGGGAFDDGMPSLLSGGWGGGDFGAVDFGMASYGNSR